LDVPHPHPDKTHSRSLNTRFCLRYPGFRNVPTILLPSSLHNFHDGTLSRNFCCRLRLFSQYKKALGMNTLNPPSQRPHSCYRLLGLPPPRHLSTELDPRSRDRCWLPGSQVFFSTELQPVRRPKGPPRSRQKFRASSLSLGLLTRSPFFESLRPFRASL